MIYGLLAKNDMRECPIKTNVQKTKILQKISKNC